MTEAPPTPTVEEFSLHPHGAKNQNVVLDPCSFERLKRTLKTVYHRSDDPELRTIISRTINQFGTSMPPPSVQMEEDMLSKIKELSELRKQLESLHNEVMVLGCELEMYQKALTALEKMHPGTRLRFKIQLVTNESFQPIEEKDELQHLLKDLQFYRQRLLVSQTRYEETKKRYTQHMSSNRITAQPEDQRQQNSFVKQSQEEDTDIEEKGLDEKGNSLGSVNALVNDSQEKDKLDHTQGPQRSAKIGSIVKHKSSSILLPQLHHQEARICEKWMAIWLFVLVLVAIFRIIF